MAAAGLLTQYVDLQINGFAGIDFNDPQVTPEEIERAAQAMQHEGVVKALPTIITGSLPRMRQCIENVRQAIESLPTAAHVFCGIHLEGPFLSPQPGYIGAHPREHALPCDRQVLADLLDAGGGWVKLVTLAPEIDRQGLLTKQCVERGLRVAAGHTDASLAELEVCLDQGLTLFTHLGNGCPRLMDRHDNIIMRALRCSSRLTYTLIADGFHVPQVLFENLLAWVPADRLLVVSDAICAAGLGPGTYRLAQRQVTVGADKAARDPSGEHFVGAASSMRDADRWLCNALGVSVEMRQMLLVDNPRRMLAIDSALDS